MIVITHYPKTSFHSLSGMNGEKLDGGLFMGANSRGSVKSSMISRYDIGAVFGGGGRKEFFKGPSAADQRAEELRAADEAKRKSLAESQNRSGAASTLYTAGDLGTTFGQTKTRQTLLGSA